MIPTALQCLVAVLALSNLVFFARVCANPLVFALIAAAITGALMVLYRNRARLDLSNWRTGASCLAMAFVICLVGGEGHFFFTPADWVVRDAVLADLVRGDWPVTYRYAGQDLLLRAPVGFYMLPALVGRGLGLRAAHLALLAQDTLMLAAFLALITAQVEARWRKAVLLGVFFAFCGWDIIGEIWAIHAKQSIGLHPRFPLHIQRWTMDFEYSAFLTDIFWAPNHALPAFAFLGGYLCWRKERCSSPALAAIAALSLLWSPLAVMGSTPFLLVALATDLRRGRLRVVEIAAAGVLGVALLPVALYLTLDSGAVAHGPTVNEPYFWGFYFLFFVIDIGPLLYLLLSRERDEARPPIADVALIVLMLVLLPLYRIGVSNDFMMRASIVPLALGAVIVGERLAGRIERRRWAPLAIACGVLAIGAVTPAFQIARAFYYRATPPVTETTPQAWADSAFGYDPMSTYVAPIHALDRYGWLFRPAPDAPQLRQALK